MPQVPPPLPILPGDPVNLPLPQQLQADAPAAAAVVGEQANDPADEQHALVFGAKRPLKSDVWPHFTRFVDKNWVMKAKCKYCRKILGGDTSNGTSHLRNHKKVCVQKQIHDGSQKNLAVNFLSNGVVRKKELCSGQFNNEVLSRKQLATMIVIHEYPLGIVDHLYFKIFCNGLQPLFKVPSRNTTKKDILAMYEIEKKKIQRVIDGNKGRIAITTDMWTATNQKRGYMAITGNYIDNHDILRAHFPSLPYVPVPHTSEKLAKVLHDCLMSWNMDCKLSTITLDNCSTNDALIDKIKRKLVISDLLVNGSLLQMR
ncbi:Zinc finger BED domain-containing protein RICESLEEPER 1 [Linum grandiflorum]